MHLIPEIMFVIVFLLSVFFSLSIVHSYILRSLFVYLFIVVRVNVVHCVYVLIFIDYEFIEMSLLYIEYYYS